MIYATNPVKTELKVITDKFCFPAPITMGGVFSTTSNTIAVSTLTSSGNVATLTTSTAHNLKTGAIVEVIGADQSGYNGLVKITVTTTTRFTYYVEAGLTTPATGTILVDLGGCKASGTDTNAGTDFVEGDFIYVASENACRQVDKIYSATSWSFKDSYSTTLSNEPIKVVKNGVYTSIGFKNTGEAEATINEALFASTSPSKI